MKLSDKIVRLRKSNGMSQEELADKLGVSRQAISRWEMGTAMPDATNILQLSRLFQVTTDYLLNDEYQSDNDLPKVKEVKTDGIHQIMIFLITLEVMVLIIQFMSVMILQNIFFGVLSFIPFIAMVGGFEYAYQKKANVHVADGLFCREIDGLFCRSSPDIIVRRRCVLSHKRRGWLQPSPSFRYSRNLALQDELYHPVINNGPAVLVCVDKRLGTGPVNQSRDAG